MLEKLICFKTLEMLSNNYKTLKMDFLVNLLPLNKNTELVEFYVLQWGHCKIDDLT